MFSNPDVTTTVTIAYIALCVGEFISFVSLFIFYRFHKKYGL